MSSQAQIDKAALDASDQIMRVVNGSWLPGGAPQVQAKIQCIVIETLKSFAAHSNGEKQYLMRTTAAQPKTAAPVSDKDADYADLYRFVRDRGCNVAWAAIGAGECLEEFDKTIRSAMAQQAGKKDGK